MPVLVDNDVKACCPDCGAITTFEHRGQSNEFGSIHVPDPEAGDKWYFYYRLLRCASCGRGGLSTVRHHQDHGSELLEFFPVSVERLVLPGDVPADITAEFQEAEDCLAWGARRAASALFRSTLEKTLKANGYTSGNLAGKIDEAAADGIVTETRRKRAHDEVRVLGNNVLHDECREIDEPEAESTHRYVQRILEDFYDDRPTEFCKVPK